jgi:hypothetical protein
MEISTPSSSKPLSITPSSRVLRSPLSDEQIWKRLRDAGFDEESIKHKDKAALVAYIVKLEAEVRKFLPLGLYAFLFYCKLSSDFRAFELIELGNRVFRMDN